jgi:hypothetical protein
MSETAFVVAQLLPKYRNSSLIVNAIGPWYAAACLLQGPGWSTAFAAEEMVLALAFMFGILICLVKIVWNLSIWNEKESSEGTMEGEGGCSRAGSASSKGGLYSKEYWLLQFTHSLHCGWIIDATVVNLSVVVVDQGYGAGDSSVNRGAAYAVNQSDQLTYAIISLCALSLITFYCLSPSSSYSSNDHCKKKKNGSSSRQQQLAEPLSSYFKHLLTKYSNFCSSPSRNLVIVLVQAWALNGIAKQLTAPYDVVIDKFPMIVITAVRDSAKFLSAIVTGFFLSKLCSVIVEAFLTTRRNSERVTEDSKESEQNVVEMNLH